MNVFGGKNNRRARVRQISKRAGKNSGRNTTTTHVK